MYQATHIADDGAHVTHYGSYAWLVLLGYRAIAICAARDWR